MKETIHLVLPGAAATGIILLLFLFRDAAAAGICDAMTVSLCSLIPALFPIMTLSTFFSGTALADKLCRLFSVFTRYLFRLPERAFLPVFLGLFCGYPVGASISSKLLNEGSVSREEAGRLMLFTMNPGIAFCLIFIPKLSGDMHMGLTLFVSLSAASLILGIISGIGKSVPKASPEHKFSSSDFFSLAKDSAEGAGRACFRMCIYMLLFSALSAVFSAAMKLIPAFSGEVPELLLRGLSEVTLGVNGWMSSSSGGVVLLLFLSFGGICIHFQIFSFFKLRPISYPRFLLARLLHFGLSFLCFLPLSKLYTPHSEVFSAFSRTARYEIRGNLLASVFMLLMFLCFVMTTRKDSVERERKM